MSLASALAAHLAEWLMPVVRPTAIMARYTSTPLADLPAALAGDPDFAASVAMLVCSGLLTDRLASTPLLPAVSDLAAGAAWSADDGVPVAGNIAASAASGEPVAALYLPARGVYAGAGLPIVDYVVIEFSAPVTVSAIDLTVPSAEARPDIIAVDAAAGAAGPWAAVLTHDPGNIVATQRVSVGDVSATHWRISVSVPAGVAPAVIALQLHGRAAS